jgi:hypothetical protein
MNAIDPLGALLLTVAVAELQLHRLDLIETLRKLGHLQLRRHGGAQSQAADVYGVL